MSSLNQTLLNLGFAQSEIDVYSYTLKNGPKTIEELNEEIGLSKLSLVATISNLLQNEFISFIYQNEEKLYHAEHPNRIVDYVQNQLLDLSSDLDMLKELKGELEGQMSDQKPVVLFYEGKEGLKKMLDEHLFPSSSKQMRLIYPLDDVKKLFTAKEKEELRRRRVEAKIHSETIYSSVAKRELSHELSNSVFVDQNKYPIECEIEIFNDKVVLAIFSGEISGLVIRSKPIANTFKTLFRLSKKAILNEEI